MHKDTDCFALKMLNYDLIWITLSYLDRTLIIHNPDDTLEFSLFEKE